ncbi:MAG: S8 family serine peptidase [Chloroflexota bacterium]
MVQHRVFLVFVTVCLFLSSVFVSSAQEPTQITAHFLGKIDPEVIKLLSVDENARADVMILMHEKANLSVARQQADVVSRRTAIVETLQETARQSQAEVLAILGQATARQTVGEVRPLWIVNGIAANIDWHMVITLASRSDVRSIRLETVIQQEPLDSTEAASRVGASSVEWGIAQVQAPNVWQALDIDGTGIVIASVDSGVDYLHQDLRTRYRGYNGETLPALHTGHWFDAIDSTTYPNDDNGHGTHTTGTALGENGIGVAPGATWIGVKVFDASGTGQEKWILDGFQWLLAPNGDPSLAPDIVNNSWGTDLSTDEAYTESVQHLLDAGIIPLFANGNSGPQAGTVGSPASLDISFGVGALDQNSTVANFSSRGPSPWGKIKPDVSAPGVAVRSSLPGGIYGLSNGTSMATPHVSGIVALMLQADPTLTYEEVGDLLKQSATPLSTQTPNNDTGWGAVNAYDAVRLVLNAGTVTGQVTDQGTGQPIAEAKLTFTQRGSGQTSFMTSSETGHYEWAGLNGDYDVTVSSFGYESTTTVGVNVISGVATSLNIALNKLPTGQISGMILETGTNNPVSGTLSIENTDIQVSSSPETGAYSLSLPSGSYTLTVTSSGYRITDVANIIVNVGVTTIQNVTVDPAPTILLVDSGGWYYRSQIDYYQTALNDARYHYDLHTIGLVPSQTPISTTLTPYDIVIWSSPQDSPGLVGAGSTLEYFLDQGGKLILSGQDVALHDGAVNLLGTTDYYETYLYSQLVTDDAQTVTVVPTKNEAFDGLSLTILGGDGADNQTAPDIIEHLNSDFAEPVLHYEDDQVAGLRVGHCLPYRALNLAFGIEGINDRTTRSQFMARAIDALQREPVTEGIDVSPPIEVKSTQFGGVMTHAVRIRNSAEVGNEEQFSVTMSQPQWQTSFNNTTITLAPCQSQLITYTVAVPADAGWSSQDQVTITVQSTSRPQIQTVITRTSKAPSPVLLVDDDRWFDYGPQFRQALEAGNIPFDYWDTVDGNPDSSPPLERLLSVPIVIWFNGYDWFNPLTKSEEDRIQAFLDQGGRFGLTSQEYLFKLPDHKASVFAQDYLGVYTHSEILSSTLAIGFDDSLIGNNLGSLQFSFPSGYQNWTDTVTPTTTAKPIFLSQDGLANSLTNSGGVTETWHTAFFGFGLELLNDTDLSTVLRRTVGWLSWLGTSDVQANVAPVVSGDVITYTAVLQNDGLEAIQTATFTATFPYPLSLVPGSATNGALEQDGQVLWEGGLEKNEAITFTYQAQVANDTPYGTLSEQVSWIGYEDHKLWFDRVAAVPVNVPEWPNTILSGTPAIAEKGDILTYTLTLTNSGLVDAPLITVTSTIPDYTSLLTDTIQFGTGTVNTSQLKWRTVYWTVSVPQGSSTTVGYAVRLASIPARFQVHNAFIVDDGFKQDRTWETTIQVQPEKIYLPTIQK